MMTCRIARAFAVAMVLLTAASAAQATTVYVTTAAQNTVGGLSFGRGDVVAYDMDTDTATLAFSSYYFRNSNGRLNEVVDVIGVHAAGFGKVYLSMESGGYLGADGYRVHFRPGDIVLYDTLLDRAELYFVGREHFVNASGVPGVDENIDGFHIMSNGHLLLTTAAGARLLDVNGNPLFFTNADLIEYDIGAKQASLYLSDDVWRDKNGNTEEPENVDALGMLCDGETLLMSTASASWLGDPLKSFSNGDIIAYDKANDTAWTFLSADVFFKHCSNDNIDGLSILYVSPPDNPEPIEEPVPEPVTMAGMLLGLAGLVGYVRRRR